MCMTVDNTIRCWNPDDMSTEGVRSVLCVCVVCVCVYDVVYYYCYYYYYYY